MMTLSWMALALLAPAQDGAKKLPPPLQEVYSAADREYSALAFSPDGRTLAAGASGSVRVFTVDDGKFAEAKVLRQYGRVDELIFDLAHNVLVSRSRDQDALVWELDSWAPVKFAIEDLAVGGLAIRSASQQDCDPGTSCLALANRSRGLRLWRLDSLRRKPRSVAQADVRSWGGVTLGRVTSVAWAGSTLLAGDEEGYLYRLPDARSAVGKLDEAAVVLGRIVKSPSGGHAFRPHDGEVTAIALADAARRCVTSGMDGKVRLWDLQKIPMTAPARRSPAFKPEWEIDGQAAEISSDGKLLAVANAEGVGVYLASSGIALSWNPASGRGGRVVRLRFDPDGKHLAGLVCRCSDCAPGNGVAVVRLKRRLADHGGALVVWK
jgi:WD40 repeat protein